VTLDLRPTSESLLLEKMAQFRTVIMPDFFIDRIVKLSSFNDFLKKIEVKRDAGGGSVHSIEQVELRGGNAANVAYGLGRLGVGVDLIAVANWSSAALLRHIFSTLPNVSIDAVDGRPGYTVSLEFPHQNRLVNVMLSDVGDVGDFTADKVPVDCRVKIREADLVGVFNWAANKKGSELASQVFQDASENGVMTYFAPADVSGRSGEIPKLLSALQGTLDILSINENEARIITEMLSIDHLPLDYQPDHITRCVELISNTVDIRVDMHTPFGSASSYEGLTYYSPSFEVERRISTGAGDVWDSANITGYLLQLDPPERLRLANAAAALYISSLDAESPSTTSVLSLLETSI
jgi:ribokinase